MKIILTVSYDGTDYCGWQIQPKGDSIQQRLQDAVKAVTGETVKVTGSGRTDAGVHAAGQVAHFDTESDIKPEKFARALNAHLPCSIRVTESRVGDENFNACTSAKRKTYEYSLYYCDVELPLKERYSYRLIKKPDISAMKKGAEIFVGEHDFKCFNASRGGAKTTVRTIYSIDITESNGDIKIAVCGNGFLYNMVRTLVGTLIDYADGKTDKERLEKALKTGERALLGKTVPAKGLCLKEVEYQ